MMMLRTPENNVVKCIKGKKKTYPKGICNRLAKVPHKDSYLSKGSFKNHVDMILLFFDHRPTLVDISYVLNVDKNGKF